MQNDTDVSPNRVSHKLIDDQSYASTYLRIKYNWAHQVAQNWNERSDPQKVVYEDCGIASYLLELWNKYEILPNKFADLGCGNGLLVYLLAKENANGVGVDVRKRKIWEQLADSAQLYEVAIDPTSPSTSTVLNEVDFLIGNHSDELTPWIPVMAARRKCNFFLLPCCAFDFFSKFSRTSRKGITGVGVPDTYHNFIRSVIQKLGFDLKEDQLKIPSRKTKCFIGTIPGDGLPENVEEIIEELLSVARQIKSTFSARPAIQQLRNCSAISHDFRLATTKKFFDYLLALEDTENKDLRMSDLRAGIVRLWEEGKKQSEIARDMNVPKRTVSDASKRFRETTALSSLRPVSRHPKLFALEHSYHERSHFASSQSRTMPALRSDILKHGIY